MPYVRYYDAQYRIDEFNQSVKIKKKLLNVWPRTLVNGIEVFDIVVYYFEWRRANGVNGCKLEPDEGYWENGIQYLPGGFDHSKRNKKIYDLLGVKIKPDNYKNVKKDYNTYYNVFRRFIFNSPTNAEEAGLIDVTTLEYPMASYDSISTYIMSIPRDVFITDLENKIIDFMQTVVGYIDVAVCISKDEMYLENAEVGSGDGRIDRLYYYIGNDDTLINEEGTFTMPTGVDPNKLYNELVDSTPLIYPLNRDPFNADPLLPYQVPDPNDPLKLITIVPELTDLNPDPDKNTENAQWDKNGWVTVACGVVPSWELDQYEKMSPIPQNEVLQNLKEYGRVIATNNHPDIELIFAEVGENKATLAALLDVEEVLFERTFRVVSTKFTDNREMFYNIEFKYRRVHTTEQFAIDGTYIISEYDRRYSIWLDRLIEIGAAEMGGSSDEYTLTLATMYAKYRAVLSLVEVPTRIAAYTVLDHAGWHDDNDIVEVALPWSHAKGDYSFRVKVSSIQDMKSKKLSEYLKKRLRVGSTNNRGGGATFFETFVSFALLFAAVLLAPTTGGASLALYWGAVAVAFAVMAAVANALGYGGFAQQMMMMSQVAGYISMTAGISNFVTSAATKEIAKQGIVDYIIETIKTTVLETIDTIKSLALGEMPAYVVKATTQEILEQLVSMLNKAFMVYTKYINPPNEGLKELQDMVKKQEDILAEMTTPDTVQAMHMFLDSPFNNMYDMNEVMHNSYYNMTQGKIDASQNRCYLGSAPFRYDPYWGS